MLLFLSRLSPFSLYLSLIFRFSLIFRLLQGLNILLICFFAPWPGTAVQFVIRLLYFVNTLLLHPFAALLEAEVWFKMLSFSAPSTGGHCYRFGAPDPVHVCSSSLVVCTSLFPQLRVRSVRSVQRTWFFVIIFILLAINERALPIKLCYRVYTLCISNTLRYHTPIISPSILPFAS